MANRWSGRLAYTLQRSNYVGIGNPDARRVWLDNDPRADYGEFSSNRTERAGGQRHLEPVAVAHLRDGGQRHQRRADQRDRRPRRQRRPRQQRSPDPRHRRPGPADPVGARLAGPRGAVRHPRARLVPGRPVGPLSAAPRRPARQPRLLLRHVQRAQPPERGRADRQPVVAELHDRDVGAVPAADRSSASGCGSEDARDASTCHRSDGGRALLCVRHSRARPRWSWASSRAGSSTTPARPSRA